MTWTKHILTALFLLVPLFATKGQDSGERPINSVYSLEIGGARNLSTYLSPLYYEGTSYALAGSWTKIFNRWENRCRMRFEAGINYDHTLNPVKNSAMYGLTARFAWGLAWRKTFARDWEFTLGPMIDIYGGALYLPRNGNNPVTALASAGIDASASIRYKFNIGRIPVIVSDQANIPTLEGFFCPGYGESYYEIYLGNHKNLAHLGWWGNAWGINNLLSATIFFGKTGLQLGYRLDLRTFKANNLQTQVMRNAFVVGISL